jgi:hypothetical protein
MRAKWGRGLGDGSGTNVILLRFGGTGIVLDPDTARQGLGGGHGWLPRLDSIYHGLSRLTYILEKNELYAYHDRSFSTSSESKLTINTFVWRCRGVDDQRQQLTCQDTRTG